MIARCCAIWPNKEDQGEMRVLAIEKLPTCTSHINADSLLPQLLLTVLADEPEVSCFNCRRTAATQQIYENTAERHEFWILQIPLINAKLMLTVRNSSRSVK